MKLLEVFEKGEKYTTEMSSLRHERERDIQPIKVYQSKRTLILLAK